MIETIDLNEGAPSGHYKFRVVGIPEKIKLESGHVKRIWLLSYTGEGGEEKQAKFFLFPSQYAPIVSAIGGVKVNGKLEWDDEKADGKTFDCLLEYVPSKDGKYSNAVFKNCEESLPF